MDTTSDTEPATPDQVVLYEPRDGVAVADQPVLHDMLVWPRRQLFDPIRWVLIILLVVALVYPGQPLGIVGPAILLAIGLLGTALAAARFTGEFGALADARTRLVTFGAEDLRRSGRSVALRLPDDRWVVTRFVAADVMMLARLRRVWVFGPTPGGRVGLVVPGASTPRVGRLGDPPAGATPVPAPELPTRWPPAPADDPAWHVALRPRITNLVTLIVAVVVVMGLIAFESLVIDDVDSLVRDPAWGVPAIVAVLALFTYLTDLRRHLTARRAEGWRWTRVHGPTLKMLPGPRLRLRADFGDGAIEVYGSPALVLTVYETGHLWIAGPLRDTGPMMVGIPGVPVAGRTRFVRR